MYLILSEHLTTYSLYLRKLLRRYSDSIRYIRTKSIFRKQNCGIYISIFGSSVSLQVSGCWCYTSITVLSSRLSISRIRHCKSNWMIDLIIVIIILTVYRKLILVLHNNMLLRHKVIGSGGDISSRPRLYYEILSRDVVPKTSHRKPLNNRFAKNKLF